MFRTTITLSVAMLLVAWLSIDAIAEPHRPQPQGTEHEGEPTASEFKEKDTKPAKGGLLRAKYLITVTDDFIVDLYHNGKPVADSDRSILLERFGATVERIKIDVRKGDWLVFNVVNNRMRWNGAYYFAVAGCFAKNEFGFQSELKSGKWTACDKLNEVERFISEKDHLSKNKAEKVKLPWQDGDKLMHEYAGDKWAGSALWGGSRNTWIKVVVD